MDRRSARQGTLCTSGIALGLIGLYCHGPVLTGKRLALRTVITYGTYDLFHVGHVQLLERAKALGDRLIVGVSSDEFNKIKGKKSVFPYAHRAKIVSSLSCVDHVFPEHDWGQKESDIRNFCASVFVMGHDWEGKFDELRALCDVVYLPRTEGISTTELKAALNTLKQGKIEELIKGLETLTSIAQQLS